MAEAETGGINLYSEYSLHDSLKRLAAGTGGRIEVTIGGRVADAVRADGEIVEVQCSGIGAIQAKVAAWAAEGRRVRIVRPLIERKYIARTDARTGELLSRRKSPRRETIWDLFAELTRAPLVVGNEGITLELVAVEVTEHRVLLEQPVRRGRFMRAYATRDRTLDLVLGSRELCGPADWLDLIPSGLPPPWTAATLGEALGIGPVKARQVLYTLRRAGLLASTRGASRGLSYSPAPAGSNQPEAR